MRQEENMTSREQGGREDRQTHRVRTHKYNGNFDSLKNKSVGGQVKRREKQEPRRVKIKGV